MSGTFSLLSRASSNPGSKAEAKAEPAVSSLQTAPSPLVLSQLFRCSLYWESLNNQREACDILAPSFPLCLCVSLLSCLTPRYIRGSGDICLPVDWILLHPHPPKDSASSLTPSCLCQHRLPRILWVSSIITGAHCCILHHTHRTEPSTNPRYF